jgi:hypothetical protein
MGIRVGGYSSHVYLLQKLDYWQWRSSGHEEEDVEDVEDWGGFGEETGNEVPGQTLTHATLQPPQTLKEAFPQRLGHPAPQM